MAERKLGNYVLWFLQVILAMLFLFAGSAKLIMTPEQMKGPIEFPTLFLRFIGVCEVLGGLGLILPGLFRIRTGLTPLAAALLIVIMIGAVATHLMAGENTQLLFPAMTGLLLAVVAWGRLKIAPMTPK